MQLHPSELASDAASRATGTRGHRLRRRLIWIVGLLLLVLLLVLTPPLINVNRYRNNIAHSMSASLGRPVHLDNVTLHLLPVPGFTLENLVVSEDPSFGAEPTIRANTVEATLRLSSLWHRPVEFSTVRFVDPSVNLVRDAAGRWNLSEVLLHASHVNSAPTAQRHAGPTPRFPYIEATGGRVNVKFGEEKLPFSLTDADFALWLPSPQQWRVRLVGHPARTDTNITDPGTVRLEGELRHADRAMEVPASFTMSWHDAPLGEATRILTGDDLGWRGTLNLDATLEGKLGEARIATKLTLGGLRRAEFFPTHPLDLQILCDSGFVLHPASLRAFTCTLPDDAPQPLTLRAETISLQNPKAAAMTVKGAAIPVRWGLLWAALYSPRVPTDLKPEGTLDVDLSRGLPTVPMPPAALTSTRKAHRRKSSAVSSLIPGTQAPPGWAGTVLLTVPSFGSNPAVAAANPLLLLWKLVPSTSPATGPTLSLASTTVDLAPGSVNVLGSLGRAGYNFSVAGEATAASLLSASRFLPELGDGVEPFLPYPPTNATPSRVQFTCVRNTWSKPQVCSGFQPGGMGRATGVPITVPAGLAPTTEGISPAPIAPTGPQSLSPLERAPFSTPRPLTTPQAPSSAPLGSTPAPQSR